MRKYILAIVFVFSIISESIKAQEHPTIWVTKAEKQHVLNLVEQNDWAKSIVRQLHQRVDGELAEHQTNPNAILDSIPEFARNDHQHSDASGSLLTQKHNRILTLASDAGMLYFLTDDEKYAMFAADILAVYIDTIAPKTPQTTTICGNAFYDPRTTYGPFALAYDFIYNYLKRDGATVYNKKLGDRVLFDNAKAQKAIANMVGNTLQEYGAPDKHGKFISNHPILTAPGVLFGILCIEDDAERERLFKVFWESGTAHQNSFKQTILPMFGKQGIWPESTSYSFMPAITMVLNIVDRNYPEMNVTSEYKEILEGNFLFDNLRMPDRRFVRYGDSKRNNDGTEDLYRYTLHLAKRKGYSQLEQQAKVALAQKYRVVGGYNPKLDNSTFNNFQALDLFWGIPIPEQVEGNIDFQKPTVIVEHAGIALQRNYVEKDNELYGLCGIIGGAHYVHSHLTGISMELYGAGYVMAPNAGLPATVAERQIPLHEHYYRLYAGNNTVVVNGTSHGRDEGSWKGKANVWQNTAVNIAAEPKHLEDPISAQFSFATQALNDEVNNCVQQRTLSTIRTSQTTAYYFDLFRSKSLAENNFHDYIYHNLGDETVILDTEGQELELCATDRYRTDIGDAVHSPGWKYFENTKVTEATAQGIRVRFDIDYDNKYMHLFVPAGIEREYTKALAPPTREAKNGYINKKTQVLAIRQQGEAWEKPYVSVFEPSGNQNPSVQSVEALKDGQKVVGVTVISKVGESVITDYIICQDQADAAYTNKELSLYFEGRFGIVRTEESVSKTVVTLYVGDGNTLEFRGQRLDSDAEGKAVSIQQTISETK
ncbi:hypothetical protein [Mangrovibacterium sp.]|uniref:hypothetical protein n=1 Tax=Mangrovibacterium sp. TaxID=1961364 RepID=UPI00356ADBA4